MGAMTPPSRKSCYNFRVTEIVKVLDGDTIDILIDLGFDLYKKEKFVSLASILQKNAQGISKKKHLELTQPTETKDKLEGAIDGDDMLTIRTETVGGVGK